MKKLSAGGSSVYEKQMVGEKPSRKMPHFNYESEMRGEHPISVRKKKGGAIRKAAIGGAQKMRLGEMTKGGMQAKPKPVKRGGT